MRLCHKLNFMAQPLAVVPGAGLEPAQPLLAKGF